MALLLKHTLPDRLYPAMYRTETTLMAQVPADSRPIALAVAALAPSGARADGTPALPVTLLPTPAFTSDCVKDRVAVVTVASSGLGGAIAARLNVVPDVINIQ